MRVNFVSRGHGYGHAARDLRIMAAMRRVNPGIQIRLASAGSGADYYRSRGVEAVDLGFDDADDMGEAASWRIWRFLYEHADADLVVSDEFLTVPGFCRNVLDLPNVLITDWFFAELGLPEFDARLDDAREVVVPDFPEAHPLAPATTAPIWYCGPLVDSFTPQRAEARKTLGIDEDALVLTVAAGGRPDRIDALRIQLQALQAWSGHAALGDQLLLMADPPPTRGRVPTAPNIHWVGRSDRPELYYRAADVVLANALGFTSCELVANGVPVVAAVTPDPDQEMRIGFTERMDTLERIGLLTRTSTDEDPATLWALVQEMRRRADDDPVSEDIWADPLEVATRILGHGRVG
ncbi:glycosyl transferase [Streptomyces sp. NBC_00690]|uniref:glycosyl transferase n=1 Tax=Streptomyces sp. NBC_00690 TaxID=2975808 RepID=UPI002E298236|nr:glycosyl transferase [Streptomyces sp. NBC_00690]